MRIEPLCRVRQNTGPNVDLGLDPEDWDSELRHLREMAGGEPMRDIIRAVLAANSEFYRAFCERDVGALEDLLAVRSPVACIHPGWDILSDREEVLNSWRRILSHQRDVAIECRNATPYVFDDVAIVLCHEHLGGHVLAVTNMFRYEDGEWRMIHHQASPMAVAAEDTEDQEIAPETRRLH